MYRRMGTGGSSIMTTGDQYEHTHGMGIAMPGMGAAIPMPGLAKAGTRIPGMAGGDAQAEQEAASAALEGSHVRHQLLDGAWLQCRLTTTGLIRPDDHDTCGRTQASRTSAAAARRIPDPCTSR